MTNELRRLLDVNVLMALALNTHVHHRAGHRALASMRTGWATCAFTETSLLRLMLNPRVVGRPFTTREVLHVLRGMHEHPTWTFLEDAASPVEAVIDLDVLVGHQQVTDLHLVDLAARHGAVLATFDAHLVEGLAPADRRHVELLPQ